MFFLALSFHSTPADDTCRDIMDGPMGCCVNRKERKFVKVRYPDTQTIIIIITVVIAKEWTNLAVKAHFGQVLLKCRSSNSFLWGTSGCYYNVLGLGYIHSITERRKGNVEPANIKI